MERLRELVGCERALGETAQVLHFAATGFSARGVGAMHVTCADESETECAEAFQKGFARFVLPPLKFSHASPFRIANLGGRYEWGAVRIAEEHFAPAAGDGFELLVVKINSHVAFEELTPPAGSGEPAYRFGAWKRYGRESACCGALAGLLGGAHGPFVDDLRELFVSEGRDRLATLRDEGRVDPRHRPLFAALVSARLQARKAVLDIQDYQPSRPTVFVVVPCATVNRRERDSEIICGIYSVDGRDGDQEDVYYGLGDDPSAYELSEEHGRFHVTDDHVGTPRKARDHRALVRERWERGSYSAHPGLGDERLERIKQDVARNKHRHHHHARALLRAALPILAEVAPIPVAILMFAEGAAGIHHTFRIHQLARDMSGTAEARRILDEIHQRVDQLDPDHAEALIELLMKEYK